MKREILFKAKRVDNGEWVEGYYVYLVEDDAHYISYPVAEEPTELDPMGDNFDHYDQVDPETVCQYTGLKDKNGVKIFEGDNITSDQWSPSKYKVLYDDGAFVFVSLLGVETPYNNDISYARQFEVTGNIHD